jgi:2-alkyl-3-oxoalkanoate reductase
MTFGPIIVTGAGGFVGSQVVRSLAAAGHAVIAGFRTVPDGPMPDGVTAMKIDVMDAAGLAGTFEGSAAVVHCAVGPPRDTSVIVEGTRNAMIAAREGGVQRFIQLSSVAVYGAAEGHLTEDDIYATPSDAYGTAKLAAEAICKEESGDMALSILRPSLIYGSDGAQWTTLYLNRLKTGHWPALGAAGEGTCNLIHVDDLAGFIVHIIGSPVAIAGTFNVNGDDIPSWNGYLEALGQAVGAMPGPVQPVPGAAKLALRKVAKALGMVVPFGPLARFVEMTPSADEVARFSSPTEYAIDAMVATGFRPLISLEEGIAGIAAWDAEGQPSRKLGAN